jgi:hypothetical protein
MDEHDQSSGFSTEIIFAPMRINGTDDAAELHGKAALQNMLT